MSVSRKKISSAQKQQGLVLVTGLIFLLVLTLLSVVGSSNSALNLQIAGSIQDKKNAFHVGEAALQSVLWLENEAPIADELRPLHRDANDSNPFEGLSSSANPLQHVSSDTDVQTQISFRATRGCKRAENATSQLKCDYYQASSDTMMVSGARSVQNLGILKEVIGSASW